MMMIIWFISNKKNEEEHLHCRCVQNTEKWREQEKTESEWSEREEIVKKNEGGRSGRALLQ